MVKESTLSSGSYLVCRAGPVACVVPVEHVSETMRPLEVQPIVGTPSFISGVSIIRGVPTPVVDTARMLGMSRSPRTARFVNLRIGSRHVAIAVDAVLGVRSLSARSLEELPPLMRDASSDVIAAIGTLDADLLVVLSATRVVPDAVFALLDGVGAQP